MSSGIHITNVQLDLIDQQGKDAREILLFLIEKRMTGQKWSVRSLASEKSITRQKTEWWLAKIYEIAPSLKTSHRTVTGQSQDSFSDEPSTGAASFVANRTVTGQSQDKPEKEQKKCATSAQSVDNSRILGIAIEPSRVLNQVSRTDKITNEFVNCIIQNPVKHVKHISEEILTFYHSVFHVDELPFKEKNLMSIAEALDKGHSKESLCQAIEGYTLSEFFMKIQPLPLISYIFKDDERILNLRSNKYKTYDKKSYKIDKTVTMPDYKEEIREDIASPEEAKRHLEEIGKAINRWKYN